MEFYVPLNPDATRRSATESGHVTSPLLLPHYNAIQFLAAVAVATSLGLWLVQDVIQDGLLCTGRSRVHFHDELIVASNIDINQIQKDR